MNVNKRKQVLSGTFTWEMLSGGNNRVWEGIPDFSGFSIMMAGLLPINFDGFQD